MILSIVNHKFLYEIEKICRLFMPFEKFQYLKEIPKNQDAIITLLKNEGEFTRLTAIVTISGNRAEHSEFVSNSDTQYNRECEVSLATALFRCLEQISGHTPKWGILTGIRPARLLTVIYDEEGQNKGREIFKNRFLVDSEKLRLCENCALAKKNIVSKSSHNSFSLYISIPFCPTRCTYCSFVSHSVEKAKVLIPQYVDLLCRELEYTAEIAKNCNLQLETVYVGGGTPTILEPPLLDKVLKTVYENFDMLNVLEFTVEAGRPDTITEEKLEIIKNNKVTRISINPQTMNDNVLETIGRRHTAQQMIYAFNMARDFGFDNINTDLIVGLYSDTEDSFAKTLDEIIKLDPESITVHTLSMKRASSLSKQSLFYNAKQGEMADKMLNLAQKVLGQNCYLPYYMYRQSKTVGNLENVGYCKVGKEGLYNVYIMDETHTILACGASSVTKLRQPNGDNIERIFNYKYPYEYISKFQTILDRKKKVIDFYDLYSK